MHFGSLFTVTVIKKKKTPRNLGGKEYFIIELSGYISWLSEVRI